MTADHRAKKFLTYTYCDSSTALKLGLLVEPESNLSLSSHFMNYFEASNRFSLHRRSIQNTN